MSSAMLFPSLSTIRALKRPRLSRRTDTKFQPRSCNKISSSSLFATPASAASAQQRAHGPSSGASRSSMWIALPSATIVSPSKTLSKGIGGIGKRCSIVTALTPKPKPIARRLIALKANAIALITRREKSRFIRSVSSGHYMSASGRKQSSYHCRHAELVSASIAPQARRASGRANPDTSTLT